MTENIKELEDEIKSLEQLQESNSFLLSRSDNKKAINQIELLREKIRLILEADNQESNVIIKKRKRSSEESKKIIYANGKFNKLANKLNFLLLKSINDKKGECEILSNKIATMKIEILSRENPVLYKELVAKEKKVVELEKKKELWKSEIKDAEWRIDNDSKKIDSLKKKYNEIRKNGELLQEEISEYSLILGFNRRTLNNLKAKFRNMKKSNCDVLDEIEQHNNTISALEESIEELKNGKVNAKIVALRKERSKFKITYKKLMNLRVNYDYKLKEERKKINNFKKLLAESETKKKKIEEEHGKISFINNNIKDLNIELTRLKKINESLENEVYEKNLEIERQKKENTDILKNRDIICVARMKTILENHKHILEERELFIEDTTKRISDFIENGTNLRKSIKSIEDSIRIELDNFKSQEKELQNRISTNRKKFEEKFKSVCSEIQEEMLICPISQELIEDPILCEDGYIYERSAILNWWNRSKISPITKQMLYAKPGINIQGDCIKVFYKSMVDAFKLQEKKKENAASSKFVDSIIKGN